MAQHPAHAQDYRHPDEPRPDQVIAALDGLTFPARKHQIVETAQRNGADGEVRAVIDKFTDRHFDSLSAIQKELARVE